MALTTAAYPGSSTTIVNKTNADKFIPEIWSDEVIAAYKKNLVLANLVNKMTMRGKKGDTLHIPKPTRGAASAKAANTVVNIQADTETEVQVVINKHFEYSRFIEDIVEVQALASLRRFYTEDAGYALAKKVDDELFTLGQTFGDGTSDWTHSNSYYIDASTGLTAYAEDTVVPADVFTDAGFRALIKLMDDADVPMDGRFFVVPPSLRAAIMGIDRYNSSDFVDGRGVQNGQIGSLYGIDIFVSSNCPIIETDANNTATAGGDIKAAILAHKDAMVLAEQMAVRSQTQYKQEYLSTLYTADTLFGVKTVRPEAGFVLAVNA
jgi:HK97 family phage major capsid protein